MKFQSMMKMRLLMMIHKKSSLLVMRIPMNDVNDVNEMNDVHQMLDLHLHPLLQISLLHQNKACKMIKYYVKTILM